MAGRHHDDCGCEPEENKALKKLFEPSKKDREALGKLAKSVKKEIRAIKKWQKISSKEKILLEGETLP